MAYATRLLTTAVLSLGLALPAMAEDAPTADTVVASVNGKSITLGAMIAARAALPEQYQSLQPDVLFKGLLDQLVQQSVLSQSIEGSLTKTQTLQLENETRGYLSNLAIQQAAANVVTDESVKAAYDARFKDFKPQTEYHAAHILVDSEEKANDLKKQLEGGAKFDELAKANSTDTGSGANGGDLGWFGTGMMVKPFEDAVIAAPVGKVVGPVKSDFGYHLILVSETRPSQQPSLEDLREELSGEIQQKAVEAKVDELTKAAKIEKPGEKLDPALLTKTDLLDK
jgi:peptidyl-prolyl cis-trans isomerase C